MRVSGGKRVVRADRQLNVEGTWVSGDLNTFDYPLTFLCLFLIKGRIFQKSDQYELLLDTRIDPV